MKQFFSIFIILLFSFNFYAKERETMQKQAAVKPTHCVPCEGGAAPLNKQQINEYLEDFFEWKLLTNPYKIERIFTFKNFIQAMKFVNNIAQVAEHEGHHPDIIIVYNKVTIQIYTHAIQGLSANDFILADLIDELYN